MKEELCEVISNDPIEKKIGKNEKDGKNEKSEKKYCLMKIRAEYISTYARPGNFVMLATSNTTEPLLKRPFGILNAEPPFITIYYQVVGKGTRLFSTLKSGDSIQGIGPLGNGFPDLSGENILMIAGGRGIAPILYATKYYTLPANHNSVFLIYGARSQDDLNLLDQIETLPLQKKFLYTDDGSTGEKGVVTRDIMDIIGQHHIHTTISCGPDAMFEGLSHTIGNRGTQNYASLEAFMGCGFGICYSCVVKTTSGQYKKVCSDGPVFKLEEIAW